MRRRSNPWPALADLFAALLVTTFAGLIVIDFVGKDSSVGGDTAALQNRILLLNEALAEAESQVRSLKADLERVTAEKAGLDYLEKQDKNRGIDPRPCMLVDGRPQPLVDVTVLTGGRLGVKPLDLGGFARLAAEIPGYQRLWAAEPIAREDLVGIARPIHSWGRSGQNSLGFECVFYAHITIETESKEELATTLTYVNEFFYTQNHSDVQAFYRRGGR